MGVITKVTCDLCGQVLDKRKYAKHLERHENNPESFKHRYKLDHDDLFCKFCGSERKNERSLINHEMRCKKNPDRIPVYNNNFNNKGRAAWNRGLTKDTDARILKKAEKAVEYYKTRPGTFTGKKHTEEYKQKMSDLAFEREIGGFRFRRGIMYNDIKLDSSYEVSVAKSLDANNILWQRCQRFKYLTPSGELHHYTPDFYLPHYDVYLDPKNDFLIENINPFTGYNDIDKINWVMQQNDIRILVLDKYHLDWQSIKKLIDEK